MAVQKKPLIASERAKELLKKWDGNKQHAIKDMEGSIQTYYDVHKYNLEDPPYNVKWMKDVIEEIKKLK